VQLLGHLTYLYTRRSQMLGKTSGASSPYKNTEKKFIPLLCLQHLIFKVQPNVLTLIFYSFSVGTLKSPSVLSCNWKWTGTSPKHFRSLSYHIQLPHDLQKGATVHGQTCPYVHRIKCRTFWENDVKCGLINNMNSTIIKLGTCMANVSHQL
jgi:hypothetical protein